MTDLFGYTAKQLRDQAMKRVADNSGPWFGKAINVIVSLERGWTGIAEDWRPIIEDKIGKPHHHNIYGRLTSEAVKLGLVVPTGNWMHMKGMRSNARKSPVYRRT